VWAAEPRTTRGGQPWYSPLAILTALTLRAVFRLALRQAEGLIGSIIGLLGLDLAVPDHTTLSRRAATLEIPRPQTSSSTDAGNGAEPVHLLVDSTGLKLCGSGEWLMQHSHSLREAEVLIAAWRHHYNTRRPHSALGYRPPAPEVVLWPASPALKSARPPTQPVAPCTARH
jgi:transposase InsO family protein